MTNAVDPRGVCNLMLEEAGARKPITNLALQKLLYFVHGLHLIETKRPLVLGYFEAWKFGPVHPAAYKAFKRAGDQPITFRALKQDPLTGAETAIPNPPPDGEIADHVHRVMSLYSRMSPGQLVELSHAKGAPWDFVVHKARTSMAFGLRIPDDVILDRFKYHKVSIGTVPSEGEPREDAPFA